MIEKSTTQRLLVFFFQNPTGKFHLREISRLLKLSMPTIISATDLLAKESCIIKAKKGFITEVQANRESAYFIRQKRVYNLESVYDSGIVDYLLKVYSYPKAIILFGSFSRADDTEKSDVDIAVITKKKANINLSEYEKFLGKAISIHEVNLDKVSKEFKLNLANCILLEGSW